jgi:hypothetical protein
MLLLLTDGRIFGKITQNTGPKKYFLAGKNGGRKTADFLSRGRKKGEKYFRQNDEGK